MRGKGRIVSRKKHNNASAEGEILHSRKKFIDDERQWEMFLLFFLPLFSFFSPFCLYVHLRWLRRYNFSSFQMLEIFTNIYKI